MQDGENERTRCRLCCIWTFRILVILFFPVVLVLFLVIGTPVIASYLFYQTLIEMEIDISD
jgi:hypothetical protein